MEALHRLPAVRRAHRLRTGAAQQKLRDLHVQRVILRHQHAHPAQRHFLRRVCGKRGGLRSLPVHTERKHDAERRADTAPALKFDRAAHAVDQSLGDGHSQPCPAVGRTRVDQLLRKGFEDVLLVFLAHADARVGADELEPCRIVRAAELAAGERNGAVLPVVLDGIAVNVHQNALDVYGTAHQRGVRHLPRRAQNADAALLGGIFQRRADRVQQLKQVKGPLLQRHFAGFQLAHVQHLIHQLEQKLRGDADLLPALRLLLQVAAVVLADLHHALDAVDRRADVVAHALQELRLGRVGPLGPPRGLHQLFLILPLLPELARMVALRRFPTQRHDQHQHHRVEKQRHRDITQRIAENVEFRHIGVHIVCPPAPDHTEAAVRRLAVVSAHGEHLIVPASPVEIAQHRYLVRVKSHQRAVVRHDDLLAVCHHQRFLAVDLVAVQQRGEEQSVGPDILHRRAVISHHDALGVAAPVGRHVDIRAVRAVHAPGIGLFRVPRRFPQRLFLQLRGQQLGLLPTRGADGHELTLSVQQKNARKVMVPSAVPQQRFVRRLFQIHQIQRDLPRLLHHAHQASGLRRSGHHAVCRTLLAGIRHHA